MPIPASTSAVSPGSRPAGRPASSVPPVVLAFGAICLLVASGASVMMSLQHIGGLELPGCGGGSACARAAQSRWGAIPGVGWPISFVGAAYFTGLLLTWLGTRGSLGRMVRVIVGIGAGMSVLYIGVMLAEGMLCAYCLAVHVANLVFAGLVLVPALRLGKPASVGAAAGMAQLVVAALVVSAALGVMESQSRGRALKSYQQSVKEIAESTQKAAENKAQPASAGAASTEPAVTPPAPVAASTGSTGAASDVPDRPRRPGFTGRYLIGPDPAAMRVVMITDYQCPDCKQIEGQMREILKARSDVSLSIKHFPFCTACNATPNVPNLHPNACWAARAAEAAGMLGGDEGFHRMHDWLFDRGGSFTDAVLREALPGLGFDVQQFIALMQSDRTLKLVQEDIAEARRYGLARTPMIFINGVELKNWNVMVDALPKAIQTVAATNPAPGTAERDRPPSAAEKALADWRESNAMGWPERKHVWAAVLPSSPVRVTIIGDYLEPGTAEADRIVREALAGRSDIYYEFRSFPVDQACNPAAPRTMFPGSCLASRAAEAAGLVGGADAYWTMHEWLMTNQQQANEQAIKAAAARMGLDPAAFAAKLADPEIAKLVTEEANLCFRIGVPALPRVYVNFKLLPQWNLPNEFLIERAIEEAAKKKP